MGGQVRAVGKQLIVFGCALRHGGIARQTPYGREFENGACRHTEGGEFFRPHALVKAIQFRITQGLHPHRLPSRTGSDLPPGCGQLLVHKQRLAARVAERGKGLIANGRKAAGLPLRAHHALPSRQRAMPRFHAQVLAFVGKHRAGAARVKLGVLVIGVAQAGFDAFKPAGQLAHLAFQRIAGGLHANRHLVFGHRAVVTLVGIDRGAQITLVPKGAGTEGAAARLTGRIANAIGIAGFTRFVASQ